jgi:nitric oxide reductase NorD protein
MEEWVGLQWHRWVTRRADSAHPGEATLAAQRRAVELLLHAGGGRQRVAEAAPMRVGGERSVWQRIAGSGLRLPLPQLDAEVLALPARVALCADPALNADLYLWWAVLAGQIDRRLPWAAANTEAIPRALARFPGLQPRWDRLHAALGRPLPPAGAAPADATPAWTWIVPLRHADGDLADRPGEPAGGREGASPTSQQRRRTRRAPDAPSRTPLLLAAKAESLLTFADPLRVDRALDDEDDGTAATAAEELEALTLQTTGSAGARWRFDLDLPGGDADDLPVGPGEWLPEWDPRTGALRADRVRAQVYRPRAVSPWSPEAALRTTAAQVRRRLERQRDAPRWTGGRSDGEQLDLDAWVRHRGASTAGRRSGDAEVWQRRQRSQRDLATLLMADLSMSTDAYANDHRRVVDVIRDALYVFGEALHASGDAFAMHGFSSLRRTLRLHTLKGFDQRWNVSALARLGAVRPGYYTRMGAALRAGTRRLQVRPERRRLLLLLTDGKPHDLDGYDSAWGLEDTRQAVIEARRAGLLPFALSTDTEAGETLPRLFGDSGWAAVRRPEELATRLATLHARLTR